MSEAVIEETVASQAEMQGWFQRKVKWIGRVGAPDRVFAKDGRTVWIEFKDTDKIARSTQSREHKRMLEAGMEVHVCDTIAKAKKILGIV